MVFLLEINFLYALDFGDVFEFGLQICPNFVLVAFFEANEKVGLVDVPAFKPVAALVLEVAQDG